MRHPRSNRTAAFAAAGVILSVLAVEGQKRAWNPATLYDAVEFRHVVTSDNVTNTVYISAQLPFEAGTIEPGAPLQVQTRRVLANLDAALRAAGAAPDDVIRMHVYVTDYHPMKGVIVSRQVRKFFADRMPASTFIPVSALPVEHAALQIDALAHVHAMPRSTR
jgi:enamine deaminase RidA (YjgF/YER057c/UK114 family)